MIKLIEVSDEIIDLIVDEPKKKVNTLSSSFLKEFDKTLDELTKNKKLKLLRIKSAKVGIFIAGADIKEIATFKDEAEVKELIDYGLNILLKLQNLECMTLAVIDGACLGGGLELALACDYRIASSSALIGFPEVNLGIIPGLGGTQRILALSGLSNSIEMVTSGRKYSAKVAKKMNVVDHTTVHEWIDDEVEIFSKRLLNNFKKRSNVMYPYWIQHIFKPFIISYARKEVLKKTKGHYEAPILAIDVLGKTFGKGYEKGIAKESRTFLKLSRSDTAKNLIFLFLTSEELKHSYEVDSEIKDVAVFGSGVMGSAIGWLFLYYGLTLKVCTRSIKSSAKAYSMIKTLFTKLRGSKKMLPFKVDRCMDNLSYSECSHDLLKKDFVIEAVPEDMKIKQELLVSLETQLKKTAIIATNTSSLSLTQMSSAMRYPERFIGMHFFNPANKMPLVEVIKTEKTSQETIGRVSALAIKLGKTAIVVKDSPGFVINRILFSYLNEASLMYEEGVDFVAIDKEIESWGMPMGPFRLLDEVGIDVAHKVSDVLYSSYKYRMKQSNIFSRLQDSGWLGKKSGVGFYKYSGKKIVPNEKLRTSKNSNTQIVERCMLMMINEASMVLEDGIIEKPSYLDLAMILGTGFPAFRGGILHYSDSIGVDSVREKMQRYEEKFGQRFTPSTGLTQFYKD